MPKHKPNRKTESSDTAQPAEPHSAQPTFSNPFVPTATTENSSATTPPTEKLVEITTGNDHQKGRRDELATEPFSQQAQKPETAEEKIAKLEQNQDRMAQMLMQIVGYIDQNKQATPLMGTPQATAAPGIPGLGSLPIGEIIKAGLQLFNTPAQPTVSPIAAMFEKGMMESFNKTFESFVESINTKNRIADAVIAAIEKGTLKLTTEQAATT